MEVHRGVRGTRSCSDGALWWMLATLAQKHNLSDILQKLHHPTPGSSTSQPHIQSSCVEIYTLAMVISFVPGSLHALRLLFDGQACTEHSEDTVQAHRLHTVQTDLAGWFWL